LYTDLSVPVFLTRNNIKKQYQKNTVFYLSFHLASGSHQRRCTNLRTIYALVNKYPCYQEPYEQGFTHPTKSPILLDLLFTGCHLPFAQSTSNYFTEVEEADLATILRVAPGTVNSTYGTLRCRTDVSPLDAACVNKRIPDSVIRTLLENGADVHHKLKCNGYPVHILDDLDEDAFSSSARTRRIRYLFTCYGFPCE
jgi:hypothetical protein